MKYGLIFIMATNNIFLCGLSEGEKIQYKNALLHDEFKKIVPLIKQHGVNVELDAEKNTPLHIAASRRVLESEKAIPAFKRSDVRIIKYLIGAGASVDATNARGQTPYEFAEYNRKFDVQDYLTGSGHLMWAILERKDLETIKGLLELFSFELNQQDLRGNTPLHLAAGRGNLAIIKLLLAHGANPDIKNKAGSTPRDFAEAFGKKNVAAFFNKLASNELYSDLNKDLIVILALQ